VPWHAKTLAIGVAAYVLSPVDLIPDFIPVLGYQDDLVMVFLVSLAVAQLIPPEIMAEHRASATMISERRQAAEPQLIARAANPRIRRHRKIQAATPRTLAERLIEAEC
jgi:uncharacterized membrane protein YkvA (DUF1232 family)